MSFFLWTAARGSILTIDNLVLRQLPLVNWCCMCRCDEETMDHLLFHCKFVYALWSEVFLIFGIQWVMTKTVASLLLSWWNWLGKHSSNIWNMVPACLMWLIWQARNNHTFEDIVRSIDLLKPILVGTLFKWGKIWGFTQCISISEFLFSIRISSWGTCIRFKFWVFTIVNTIFFLWNNSLITYQKKKNLSSILLSLYIKEKRKNSTPTCPVWPHFIRTCTIKTVHFKIFGNVEHEVIRFDPLVVCNNQKQIGMAQDISNTSEECYNSAMPNTVFNTQGFS